MVSIPEPKTWVDAEQITAADLNEQVRDGSTLLVSPPRAKVATPADITVPSGWTADTDISTLTAEYSHDVTTSADRITFVTPGAYRVIIDTSWGQTAASQRDGQRRLYIYHRGSGGSIKATYRPTTHANPSQNVTLMDFEVTLSASAGDYLTLGARQASGEDVPLSVAMSARWVGVMGASYGDTSEGDPTPQPFLPGDVLTADYMNSQLRDPLSWGLVPPSFYWCDLVLDSPPLLEGTMYQELPYTGSAPSLAVDKRGPFVASTPPTIPVDGIYSVVAWVMPDSPGVGLEYDLELIVERTRDSADDVIAQRWTKARNGFVQCVCVTRALFLGRAGDVITASARQFSDAATVPAAQVGLYIRRVSNRYRVAEQDHSTASGTGDAGAIAFGGRGGDVFTIEDDVAHPLPPVPAAPVVTGYLGTLVVDWSGLGSNGVSQPVTWRYTEIHRSATQGFTPDSSTLVGHFTQRGRGQWVDAGLQYGTPYYYLLRSVDIYGNVTAVSTESSGTPSPVVGADIDDDAITAAKLAADSVTAAALADGSVNASAVTFDASDIGGATTAQVAAAQQAADDAEALAVQAAADAQAALNASQATVVTFSGPNPPADPSSGWLWFDTDDQNKMYRYDGTTSQWELVRDDGISQAVADAATALAEVDGKITTFYQDASPTADAVGDLWVETDQGNRLHRWNGSSWVLIQDAAIPAAQADATQALADALTAYNAAVAAQADADTALANASTAQSVASSAQTAAGLAQTAADNAQSAADAAAASAAAAQSTADGKIVTFYQASTPSAQGIGDLWVEIDQGNRLHRWSGSSWVLVQDQGIADALADAANAQSTADGKVVTFYQDSQPTATGVGDLWIDTNDGNKLYRWSGSAWQSARDVTISDAQADATQALADALAAQNAADVAQGTANSALSTGQAAQATADAAASAGAAAQSAASVAQATADAIPLVTSSASAPSGPRVGDIWIDESSGHAVKEWTGSAWAVRSFGSDAIATGAVTTAKITAGAVTATEIASGAITTTKIAASAVTAGQIASDAVTATKIAANAVTAGKIAANAVTATTIAAGAVGATQLQANAIIAGSAVIADGAITTAKIGSAQVTDAKIGSVSANKITTGELQAGSRIIAGVADGTRAEVTSSGLYTYRAGVPQPSASLGTNSLEFLRMTDDSGVIVSSISSSGAGYFKESVVADEGVVTPSVTLDGTDLGARLDRLSRGVVFSAVDPFEAEYSSSEEVLSAGSVQESWEIAFTAEANRVYRHYSWNQPSWDSLSRTQFEYRYTLDGTKPTIASTLLAVWTSPNGTNNTVAYNEDYMGSYGMPFFDFDSPGSGLLRMACFVRALSGTETSTVIHASTPTVIEDLGQPRENAFTVPGGASTWVEQSDPLVFQATWSGTYDVGNPGASDGFTLVDGFWVSSKYVDENTATGAAVNYDNYRWGGSHSGDGTAALLGSLGNSMRIKHSALRNLNDWYSQGGPGYTFEYSHQDNSGGGSVMVCGWDSTAIASFDNDSGKRVREIWVRFYVEQSDPGNPYVILHNSVKHTSRPSSVSYSTELATQYAWFVPQEGVWVAKRVDYSSQVADVGDLVSTTIRTWRFNEANDVRGVGWVNMTYETKIHGFGDANPPEILVYYDQLI